MKHTIEYYEQQTLNALELAGEAFVSGQYNNSQHLLSAGKLYAKLAETAAIVEQTRELKKPVGSEWV